MPRLRTLYRIDDDLQAFAERWLSEPFFAYMQDVADVDGATVTRLYCGARFQVELCAVRAGVVIPDHVHPNADTIEVGVSGPLRLRVNGEDLFSGMPDEFVERMLKERGVRINHDDVHGATVGSAGAMFLSIQRWNDGLPKSVLTDYVGQPLGDSHRKMIA